MWALSQFSIFDALSVFYLSHNASVFLINQNRAEINILMAINSHSQSVREISGYLLFLRSFLALCC